MLALRVSRRRICTATRIVCTVAYRCEELSVHRKHHAEVDTPEDPLSSQIYGLKRVLWGGGFLNFAV
jgi:fatty-acid desaturase